MSRLKFVTPNSPASKKLSLMQEAGYTFGETVKEVRYSSIGVTAKEYIVSFTTPDKLHFSKGCKSGARDLQKKSLTADLLGRAWKHYSERKKFKKMEEFISEIDDEMDFIRDIYEEEHYTASLPRFSRIVNKARTILQYRVKI